MFKRLDRKVVYQDSWLVLYQDVLEFPNGEHGTYAVADRKDGAFAVITTLQQEVVLLKQFRYPVGFADWEIPGGGIDKGEDPQIAVLREIKEEMGIINFSKITKLGAWYPVHSFCTEKNTIFHIEVDQVPEFVDNNPERSEAFVERKLFSFPDVLAMIDNCEIQDSGTAHALQLVWRKLQK